MSSFFILDSYSPILNILNTEVEVVHLFTYHLFSSYDYFIYCDYSFYYSSYFIILTDYEELIYINMNIDISMIIDIIKQISFFSSDGLSSLQYLVLLFFNDDFFHRFSFLIFFLYLIVLIITIITKIRLYSDLIKLLIIIRKALSLTNLSIYSANLINYFYLNSLYIILFWVRKKTWNRLNFRSLELKNKKNKKYTQLQYVRFFYIKFMFDIFFSVLIRLFSFSFLFIFRLVVFSFFKIISFFSYRWDLYLVYLFINIYLFSKLKSFISINLFNRVFVVVNYFKVEFFTYFVNDRSFLGGLIFYIFNTLYYKISILNNYNNWENIELISSNLMNSFYYNISPLFINHDIKEIIFKKSSYLFSFFILLIMSLIFLFITLFNYIIYFFRSIILFNDFIQLKVDFYFNYIYIILTFLAFLLFLLNDNLYYFLIIFFWFIYLIMANMDLISRFYNYFHLNYFFIFLGYFIIYIYDFLKNIFYFTVKTLFKILLKLKYIFILFFLYKIGVIYILYLVLINYCSSYIGDWLFFICDWLLYIILDAYNLRDFDPFGTEFNYDLINVMSYEYSIASNKMNYYIENSFLGRIYSLNFRGIDFSRLKWQTFNETRKSAIKILSWQKYYSNLFYEFLIECYVFFIICKNYFILKSFSFYYLFLFRYSDFNLFYYSFKKFYTLIYLFYVHLYFYLKYLYFYIVPYYIMPKYIWFKMYYLYSFFYLSISKIIFIINNVTNILLWLFKSSAKFFFYSILLIFNITDILWIYIYNLSLLVYSIINDWVFFISSYMIFNHFHNNIAELYLYYFINKSLFVDNIKDLFVNYFRLSKDNLVNFNISESLTLGSRVRSVSYFDVDNMNMEAVREYGIAADKLDANLTTSKPEVKYNRYFKDRDNRLIFSDVYLLLYAYNYVNFSDILYIKESWIFDFFARKLILYYLIDLYFIYYILLYILYYYLFEKKNVEEDNINVDYMWDKLKDQFSYKLLNNNNFFINALNYYQKNSDKKNIVSNLYFSLNNNWKFINSSFLAKIKKRYKARYKNINKRIPKKLGYLSSFVNNNNLLLTYIIEKKLYYNNKYFFYWKNIVFFDKDESFYIKYEKKNNFLYFFLSLIFKKNKYSSSIFYFFDTFNKMYFSHENVPRYLNKTYIAVLKYFSQLDHVLFRNKGGNWLLHKDESLILYKDEFDYQSEMYSLNFNIVIPNFEKIFFWIVFFIYMYYTKFHWRLSPQVDFLGRVNRFIFFKDLLINDNFFYLYDLAVYWVNNYFMFDIKNFSYEYNDYVNEWIKNKRYFKHIRPSFSFVRNNDPLYDYKKFYSYHILMANKSYIYDYCSYNIRIFISIRKFLLVIILYLLYHNLIINKGKFLINMVEKNLDIILYLSSSYRKNMININNYIKFFYKKILYNIK